MKMFDQLFLTFNESMYKPGKAEQKIKIIIPPYMKGMGDSISIEIDKAKFYANEMTIDYMVTNSLKDYSRYPKL